MAIQVSWDIVALGLGNLGTIIWVAKRTVNTVDHHKETIPHLVSVAQNMEKHLPVLYERDTQLGDRVTRLEQTHQIKGCDKPGTNK